MGGLNGNGDFTDAGESVTVTGSPGVGPYTATITHRRVRI